jgi:thioredoxin 1
MEIVSASKVKELQSEGKKLLVQYTASWCGPCRALSPRLEILSKNYPDVTFVKVDVDQDSESAMELSVRSVPTIFIYKGDELINRSTGANIDSVYTKILDTL